MAEITQDTVLHFIVSNGGRVQNQILVTHFRDFLNHPVNKGTNREKFKDYINELAAIKFVEGEKILVLKEKYCQTTVAPSAAPSALSATSSHQESLLTHSDQPADIDNKMDMDNTDGGMISKARIDEKMEVKLAGSDRVHISPGTKTDKVSVSSAGSTASLTSTSSQKSLASSTSGVSSMEDDANVSVVSVKDKIKNLNRNISDSDLMRIRPAGSGGGNKKSHKHAVGDDDSSDSYAALDADQKDWLVVCSAAEYHDMNKLLNKKPGLAKLKDLTNGYTALHWAAKSGKPDVIKMLANKPGFYVDHRSHGGFTALHLAAIHGHEQVMELLIQSYKADVNLRDNSGKKAKQYLRNSVSSKIQQLLVSRNLGSSGESFIRSSMRKSNRGKGVASLIQAMSTVSRQPLLNWSGTPEEAGDEKDGHQQTPPGSTGSSPGVGRKHQSQDTNTESSPSLRDNNDENQVILRRGGSDQASDKMATDHICN